MDSVHWAPPWGSFTFYVDRGEGGRGYQNVYACKALINKLSTGREVGVKKSQISVYVECERPLINVFDFML